MSQARRNHLKLQEMGVVISIRFLLFYFTITKELLQKQKLIGESKK